MALLDILVADRVAIFSQPALSKQDVLVRVAKLLARGQADDVEHAVLQSLVAREQLQSTGIGAGVAVPHATIASLHQQRAAFVVCRHPVAFDAIDERPVNILFALVGPKGASAQHLKTLAQVSRILRSEGFRQQLVDSASSEHVFSLLQQRAEAT